MATTTITTSIAAGAVATPLQNTQFEFTPDPAAVAFGILAEATGIMATIYMGRDLVQEESPVPIGTANQVPIWPDHFLVQENVWAGTRFKIQLRNSSGGTVVVKTTARVNAL